MEISEVEVTGLGGAITPSLRIPLRLTIMLEHLTPQEGLELISLRGELFTQNQQMQRSHPIDICFFLSQSQKYYNDVHHYLDFPLDSVKVAELERIRGGGDLKLRINAVLVIRKMHSLPQQAPTQYGAIPIWGFVRSQMLHTNQMELTIPRDTWISNVLPGVGFGKVHVVELPAVPLSACASMETAFEALRQAQELHKIGLYDEAVGKCRVALDKFYEREERATEDGKTRDIPVLKKGWETKLGKATYNWLNTALGAIKQSANLPHHSPHSHYDQFESQMMIAITTTLVAYVARTMEEIK